VQDFKLAAYDSGYEGVALIYEFKCSLTKGLREKLNNLDKRPTRLRNGTRRLCTLTISGGRRKPKRKFLEDLDQLHQNHR
jgi:hypothetical protein